MRCRRKRKKKIDGDRMDNTNGVVRGPLGLGPLVVGAPGHWWSQLPPPPTCETLFVDTRSVRMLLDRRLHCQVSGIALLFLKR